MIKIRKYTDNDLSRISEIHDAARKNELCLANLDEAFLPFEITADREDFWAYSIYIAEYEETVAGFIAFSDKELAWLYVDPQFSHRGIGLALCNKALTIAPDIYCVEVLKGNEPAMRLYKKLGFVPVSIINGAMPGNEDFSVSVIRMQRVKQLQPK